MVVVEPWIKTKESADNTTFEEIENNEVFKFGDETVESKVKKIILLQLGSLVETVDVTVVKTNIPLLLSKEKMKEWGCIINLKNDSIHIGKTNEEFTMNQLSLVTGPYPLGDL